MPFTLTQPTLPTDPAQQARALALEVRAYWQTADPLYLDSADGLARHILGQADRQQELLDRVANMDKEGA